MELEDIVRLKEEYSPLESGWVVTNKSGHYTEIQTTNGDNYIYNGDTNKLYTEYTDKSHPINRRE